MSSTDTFLGAPRAEESNLTTYRLVSVRDSCRPLHIARFESLDAAKTDLFRRADTFDGARYQIVDNTDVVIVDSAELADAMGDLAGCPGED